MWYLRFQNLFSHLSTSLGTLSILLAFYGIILKLFFTVSLMKSFLRQRPLKSKIEKHAIVGNTKVSYRARTQLKRLKIEKLV